MFVGGATRREDPKNHLRKKTTIKIILRIILQRKTINNRENNPDIDSIIYFSGVFPM